LSGVVLALDVDGVLLDAGRAGLGSWKHELDARFGVDGSALRAAFFEPFWNEIIIGRQSIEPALAHALGVLQWNVGVEEVLECWFDADYVVDHDVVDAVRGWSKQGAKIVLATNQEHRRVAYLRPRLGALLPIATVLYSADLGYQKRHPPFFAAAAQRLGLATPPRPVVFVDDDRANVDAARRHGWTAIHFTRHAAWRDEIDTALEQAVAAFA
jgi:putative hydrolase of the HAD superfamily